MFGFLVGFEDGACAFALGATLEKVPAEDFILLANLCGQDDSHKFHIEFIIS